MPTTKVCRDCGRRRRVDCFYANQQKSRPGQLLRPECKACTARRRAATRAALLRLQAGRKP